MKHLRLAFIGAGQIAQTTHLPNYKSMEGMEVSGISDIVPDTARRAAEKFAIPHFYSSHLEMIEEIKPDAVVICVPNRFHCRTVLDALEAGCHVFCEKPPAITVEEAKQMEEKAAEMERILTYGFHLRSSEEVRILHDAVYSGEMGEIYHIDVKWNRRRGVPGWGSFTSREMQGGGPLIDIGAHVLDAAMYVSGYPEIAYVCASENDYIGKHFSTGLMGKWNPEAFTVEDSLFGFVQFKNGCSMQIQTSFALNQREKDIRDIILYGSRQGARVFPLEFYGGEDGPLYNKTYPLIGQKDLHLELDRNFVQACLGEADLLVKADEGTYIQRLIGLLYQSAASGSPVVCG